MTATVSTATPQVSDATITVTGSATGATVTVQRSANGSPFRTIGTVTGASWSYRDRFAPSTGTVTYRVADDGVWSDELDVEVSTGGWWLRDLTSAALTRRLLPAAGDPQFSYERETGEYWPLGATVATMYVSKRRLKRVVLPDLMLWGPADRNGLLTLLDRGSVQLATDTGDTYWVAAATLPVISEPDGSLRASGERLLLASLEFVPVATPTGGV